MELKFIRKIIWYHLFKIGMRIFENLIVELWLMRKEKYDASKYDKKLD